MSYNVDKYIVAWWLCSVSYEKVKHWSYNIDQIKLHPNLRFVTVIKKGLFAFFNVILLNALDVEII